MDKKKNLKKDLIKLKDLNSREYNFLTSNFYLIRAALRYFAIKEGKSFTSSKIAENFPLSVPVAGSILNILEKLDIIEKRSKSHSPDIFMPKNVNLDRLNLLEEILLENHEIEPFN